MTAPKYRGSQHDMQQNIRTKNNAFAPPLPPGTLASKSSFVNNQRIELYGALFLHLRRN